MENDEKPNPPAIVFDREVAIASPEPVNYRNALQRLFDGGIKLPTSQDSEQTE